MVKRSSSRYSRANSRDADYRGTKTTIDWTKLVHMARMNKPGALEVLQDAIEIYFPRQFGRAQVLARRTQKQQRSLGVQENVYVLFDARVARRRFLEKKTHSKAATRLTYIKHPRATPFTYETHSSRRGRGIAPNSAIVWSVNEGKDLGRGTIALQRRTGGVTRPVRRPYQLEALTPREYATLRWLSPRGYDGDLLRLAGAEVYEDGSASLGALTEAEAWQFRENVENDPDAFLSSSGSGGLNDKMDRLLSSIV